MKEWQSSVRDSIQTPQLDSACHLMYNKGCQRQSVGGQVEEMHLGVDGRAMVRLLEFLQYSFGGGTDVDRPFELALDRLRTASWAQVCSIALLNSCRPYKA